MGDAVAATSQDVVENISDSAAHGAEHPTNGPDIRMGVTNPISLALPTKADIALTEDLLEALKKDAPLESEEGMRSRSEVLIELRRIVLQWIYEVGIQQGMDEESARSAGAKIFTFGSFRLGLISPGSDIDALCVAPRHISRESFFHTLVPKLQEHPGVSELLPVPDAYVPIIKIKFSGVEIDLLFARVMLAEIPEELNSLRDDNLLKNLDDKTVRSLNGCRVADQILSLVPDAERFRDTLRLIKMWAKNKGLYSNVLGFFGGITWAILVARVCQLWPHAAPSALVKRVFRFYDRWNWKNPVVLCDIREESDVPGFTAFKVWNPNIYPQDRMHLMPIITPAFPSMNSTHNVTETTQRILLAEFHRGVKVMEDVEKNKVAWTEVYKPEAFFANHKSYLKIEVLGRNEKVFTKWQGWIESKLRLLVKQLEQIPSVQVRPWPNHIAFKDSEWPHATAMFIGLTITRKGPVEMRQPVTKFVEIINGWNEMHQYAGLCEMRVNSVARKDLPAYVPADLIKPRTLKVASDVSQKRQLESENENGGITPSSPLKRPRLQNPAASSELAPLSPATHNLSTDAATPDPQSREMPTAPTQSGNSASGVAHPDSAVAMETQTIEKPAVIPGLGIVDQRLVAEGLSADLNEPCQPNEASIPDAVPKRQRPFQTPPPASPSIAIKRGKAKINVKLQ